MAAQSEFKKVFSAWDILVLAFGAMVGWGWVVSTGDWINSAGVIGAMLGFLLGGVMILFVGLTYAELTPAMPETGGEHAFSMRAMGPTGSFICTWAIVFGYASVTCFEACALPTIITYLYPDFLQGYLYTVAGFDIYATWLVTAIVVAVVMLLINIRGAETAAKLQSVLTVIIGGTGIVLVAASVITGSPSNLEGQVFLGAEPTTVFGGILAVAAVSPFFYIGFDVIPQAAEEINLPLKRIGSILVLSIVLAVVFYALVIFAVGFVMNSGAIAASNSATGLVTADAMATAFGSDAMGKVLTIAGLCGIITSWNSFLIGSSRAVYSMARSYMIPHFFTKLHPKFNTPVAALMLVGILSILAPFAGRKMLVWVVDAGNFGCVLAYFMVAVSFIILRKKEPDMKRPYKIKRWKTVGVLAVAMSGIMLALYIAPGSSVALAPQEWGMVLGWTALGAVFYATSKVKYGEKFGTHEHIYNAELDGAMPTGGLEDIEEKPGTIQFPKISRFPSQLPTAATFNYHLPVNIVFGIGKVDTVGNYAAQYGKKALIVTGGSSAKKSGLYNRVNGLLQDKGMTTMLYDKVTPNPLTTTAEEGAQIARQNGIDVIVAIGGGSIMDAAKGMAFLTVNDGDINDYIYNRKHSDEALPLIAIPTTCGTGSEGNGFAVLTNPENGDKKSLRCAAIVPKASIVDPKVMQTMPKKVLAAVGFDALCHNIEAFTANNAQPLTDAMAQYAIPLIWENLPKAYEGNMSDEVWESLCMGSTIGGMVINTAGVTLAHGMEHPVSGLKNVVHGVGLAAIEPIAVEATCRANRFKFGKAARLMGGLTAEDCGPRLRSLTRRLNMDVTLADLGVKEEDIPWLAENCLKVSAGNLVNTPGSEDANNKEALEALYRQMMNGRVFESAEKAVALIA